jgi:hypothetical protein
MERPAFVPHDHNDNPLKLGDVVAVPCVITGIDKHPDYINVALLTRWPMFPGPNPTAIILNTSQVLLVKESQKLIGDSVHVMDVIQEIKEGSGIIRRDTGESVIE